MLFFFIPFSSSFFFCRCVFVLNFMGCGRLCFDEQCLGTFRKKKENKKKKKKKKKKTKKKKTHTHTNMSPRFWRFKY